MEEIKNKFVSLLPTIIEVMDPQHKEHYLKKAALVMDIYSGKCPKEEETKALKDIRFKTNIGKNALDNPFTAEFVVEFLLAPIPLNKYNLTVAEDGGVIIMTNILNAHENNTLTRQAVLDIFNNLNIYYFLEHRVRQGVKNFAMLDIKKGEGSNIPRIHVNRFFQLRTIVRNTFGKNSISKKNISLCAAMFSMARNDNSLYYHLGSREILKGAICSFLNDAGIRGSDRKNAKAINILMNGLLAVQDKTYKESMDEGIRKEVLIVSRMFLICHLLETYPEYEYQINTLGAVIYSMTSVSPRFSIETGVHHIRRIALFKDIMTGGTNYLDSLYMYSKDFPELLYVERVKRFRRAKERNDQKDVVNDIENRRKDITINRNIDIFLDRTKN